MRFHLRKKLFPFFKSCDLVRKKYITIIITILTCCSPHANIFCKVQFDNLKLFQSHQFGSCPDSVESVSITKSSSKTPSPQF